VIYTDHVILLRFLKQRYDGADMSLPERKAVQAYTELWQGILLGNSHLEDEQEVGESFNMALKEMGCGTRKLM
jgi:hypothetical protein